MRPGLPSVCCNTSKQPKKQHCVVQIAPSVIWILLQREDGLSLSLKLFPFYTDLNRSCSFVSVRLSHVFIFVPNNSFVRRHRRVPPQQRRMWPCVPEHGGQLRVQLQEGLQAADQREDLPRWAALFLADYGPHRADMVIFTLFYSRRQRPPTSSKPRPRLVCLLCSMAGVAKVLLYVLHLRKGTDPCVK